MQPKYEPLLRGAQILARVCDHAASLDGQGFNGGDADFGHAMAHKDWYSPRMAASLKKLLPKYSRQLGEELVAQIRAVAIEEAPQPQARYQQQSNSVTGTVAPATATGALDVAKLLPWGEPQSVYARNGDRTVRKADIAGGSSFWGAWRDKKQECKDAGITIWKNEKRGVWEATLWPLRGTEQVAQPAADVKLEPVPMADWIRAKLLPYQPDSAVRLATALKHYGYGLDASEMGTGKTFVAYAAALMCGLKPIVCCPKAVKPSWRRAASHFNGEVFVENYEQFRLAKTPYCTATKVPRLKKNGDPQVAKNGKPIIDVIFNWTVPQDCVVIFDEAHKAGNSGTQQSSLLEKCVESGAKRMLLSGTLADGPMGLKAPGYALGLFPKPSHWYKWALNRGVVKGNFGMEFGRWNMIPSEKEAHQQKYMRQIHGEIFGKGKGTRLRICDIPNFPETAIYPELIDFDNNDEIKQAYDDMHDALAHLDEVEKKDRQGIILTEILRARQRTELLKVTTLARMAEDAKEEGYSVAMFVNFDDSLKELAQLLKTDCIISGSQHGPKGDAEREANIQRFQRGNFPRLGIVCVNYSAKMVLQAMKRIHRSYDPNEKPQWSEDHSRFIVCNIQAGGIGIGLHHLCGLKSQVRIPFAADTIEEEACLAVERKAANIELLNDGDIMAGFKIIHPAHNQLDLATA